MKRRVRRNGEAQKGPAACPELPGPQTLAIIGSAHRDVGQGEDGGRGPGIGGDRLGGETRHCHQGEAAFSSCRH